VGAGHVEQSKVMFDLSKEDVRFVFPFLILIPLLIRKEIVVHLIQLDDYPFIIPIKKPLSGFLLESVTLD